MGGEYTLQDDKTSVCLPWSAWYADEEHTLRFSSRSHVELLLPKKVPSWTQRQIESAVDSPVDTRSLLELSRGKQTACVVVDDLARPTRASLILPPILARLRRSGMRREDISIVVATGTHRPLDHVQLEWKLGTDVAGNYRVESHDAQGQLAGTGIQIGNRELRVNKTFLAADLKIAIGSVLPHSFAGYSGGAKMVLPGLADIEAARRSHKFVQMGLRGGTDPSANRFRTEAEHVCRRLGMHFVVCVVSDQHRDVAGVVCGDLVAAHREACRVAREMYACRANAVYDGLVLNAYPKDTDLIQAANAQISLKTLTSPIVKDNGVVLITTAATEGLGIHGLFQPGGSGYVRPQRKRALADRELWLYAPTVSESDARQLHWEGYPFYRDIGALEMALANRFGVGSKIAVLPCAPMQQLYNAKEPPNGI